MFDIGWQEIFVIGILALIVVGPKDLPQAVRTISKWVQKARSLSREFQSGVNEMVREAELQDIKKQITEGGNDIKGDIEKSIGADDIKKGLDLSDNTFSPAAAETTPVKDPASPETIKATENMEELPKPSESAPADDGDDVMPVTTKSDKA